MTLSIENLNKIVKEASKETITPTEMLGLILIKAYSCGANEVLDKVQSEIEQIEINGNIRDVECFTTGINTVLNIIDKYKLEIEKEGEN